MHRILQNFPVVAAVAQLGLLGHPPVAGGVMIILVLPRSSHSQNAQLEVSGKGGTPSYHPFKNGMFHEINHPAVKFSMKMEFSMK